MDVQIAAQEVTGSVIDRWEENHSSQEANGFHSTLDEQFTFTSIHLKRKRGRRGRSRCFLSVAICPVWRRRQFSHNQSTHAATDEALGDVYSTQVRFTFIRGILEYSNVAV